MPNETLNVNTDAISSLADDLDSLNAKYQAGIDDINSTVDSKLAECSGQIYNEFRGMYHNNIEMVLQDGQKIITKWAEVLRNEVVNTFVEATDKSINNF